jgi:hypothetical protein
VTRDFVRDKDEGRIIRFVDTIESAAPFEDTYAVENLFWALEINDHVEKADFRATVSDRVDRVLVHLFTEKGQITWVTPEIMKKLAVSLDQAGERAFGNLGRALAGSTVEHSDIDGVQLGFISSSLPFKSSLILAPNLYEVVGKVIGWPLMAVAPNRDFLYLWDARHSDFTSRVGSVVVEEFTGSSYPISPEVFEISDDGIETIGEFPV